MINLAIVGCGSIASQHARAIEKSSTCQLLMVVDILESRAREFSKTFCCSYRTNIFEMLKEQAIDGVIICTPHHLHEEMIVEALEMGKHVLCEKPITLNVKAAQRVTLIAEKNNLICIVCFQNRYNFSSIEAKKRIENGDIGEITSVRSINTWSRSKNYYTEANWRGKKSTEGGGVLINQAIHSLDLVQWLLGPAQKVKGSIDTRLLSGYIEVEDTAEATCLIGIDRIPWLLYASNNLTTDAPTTILIVGTLGTLEIRPNHVLIEKGLSIEVKKEPVMRTSGKHYWGTSHSKVVTTFTKMIWEVQHKKKLIVPAEICTSREGIYSIALIEGIYQSAKNNKWIDINQEIG